MLEIKAIIQAVSKLNSWKHVVIMVAIISAICVYMMHNPPAEVQEYNTNGKIEKITKFK